METPLEPSPFPRAAIALVLAATMSGCVGAGSSTGDAFSSGGGGADASASPRRDAAGATGDDVQGSDGQPPATGPEADAEAGPSSPQDGAVADTPLSLDGVPPADSQPAGLPAFCASYPRPIPAGGWEPMIVRYDERGRLQYAVDGEGNRIPDFSWAGYDNGTTKLPDVREAMRMGPGTGDDTQRMQVAIDALGAMPVGADGFRGALVLEAGLYRLGGTVRLRHDGVVLRGSGKGADPATNTVLLATGTSTATRVVLGTGNGSGPYDEVAGTRTNVVTSRVPVGARVLELQDASPLKVGDSVMILQPTTQAWIDAIGGGGTEDDPPWGVADVGPIAYRRRVLARSSNAITIDAPVFNHLDRSLSQSVVFAIRNTDVASRVGIENLRVDSEYASPEDAMHARNSIQIIGAQDAWVRDAVAIHFNYGGIYVQNSVRVTVTGVEALDPIGQRVGGQFYNFIAEGRSELLLFTNCHARNGRHHYVTQTTAAGIVFHRSLSEVNADAYSEGHRRWSQGLLFDNIREIGGGQVHLGCRGAVATSHGWAAVHSVIWNHQFDQGKGWLEKPPTAQNYAIGPGPYGPANFYCKAAIAGHIEQRTGPVRQESLYEAQLCDRLRP